VERLYNSEQKTKKIFNYFTFIAIFISCLGLYGLAAHMAQQKTKEIGIRKVLGAPIIHIVINLSKEFVLLVCMANAVAWPVAYYFMNKWLKNFAYRTSMGLWIFILSALAALVIALFTVSYQSIKAATANPVDSLRYE
jgi:putative ABC transport system permease protein